MNTMPTYRRGRTYFKPGSNDNEGCSGIMSLTLLCVMLLAPPLLVLMAEKSHYLTFTTLEEMMQLGVHALSSSSKPGDLVHVHIEIDPMAVSSTDPDMAVTVPGALTLSRNVEYCQWQELKTQSCETCTRTVSAKDSTTSNESYECNCVTQYNYIKSWNSHLIPSIFFDQPGAHHNPQRDPLPPKSFTLDQPLIIEDKYAVPPSLFQSAYLPKRHIDWVKGAVPKRPTFLAKWFTWAVDTTRYEDLKEIADSRDSLAADEHKFVYVGQGGYFFSPYEPTTFGKLFNLFTQYLEGSLMDWQVGDLMPSCQAGDIRISYYVQDPTEISILAQLQDEATLGMYTSRTTDKQIALIQEGERTVDEMVHVAVSNSERETWIFRALLVLWSLFAVKLVATYLGRDMDASSWSVYLAGTASCYFAVLSGVWIVTWGISLATRDILLSLLAFLAFGSVALSSATPSNTRGGWNSVWCRIGRWAKVPPSWRQEDSYLHHKVVEEQEIPAGEKKDL